MGGIAGFFEISGDEVSIMAAIHFILADLFPFVTPVKTDLPPRGSMLGLNLISFQEGD